MTSFLASRGFRQAVIRAHPANENSIAVARRCGFQLSGTITTTRGETLVVYKKATGEPGFKRAPG